MPETRNPEPEILETLRPRPKSYSLRPNSYTPIPTKYVVDPEPETLNLKLNP